MSRPDTVSVWSIVQFRNVPVRRARLASLVERSEEHTSELQSPCNLVCRLLLEKKKTQDLRLVPLVLGRVCLLWPPGPSGSFLRLGLVARCLRRPTRTTVARHERATHRLSLAPI